ncbi:SGNH/GDSL hydrolase family protein [Gordonia sp. NPDC003504]
MRWLRSLTLLAVALLGIVGCARETGSTATPSTSSGMTAPSAASSSTAPADPGAAYVHLGDSYAAGTGVLPVVGGSPFLCQRSALNFGHLIAQRRDLAIDDVSCAGATTADLTTDQYYGIGPQLDALGPDTRLVTMMLGGNDENTYGGAVSKCSDLGRATGGVGSPCRNRYGDELTAPIDDEIRPALTDVLRQIREQAPNARVVIVGYPWILPAADGCYPTMQVAAGDVGYLRDLQATLNDAVRHAADDTGATFVDMAPASEGHDACAGADRWIEPQQGSSARITLHPNATGQQALADRVMSVIGR